MVVIIGLLLVLAILGAAALLWHRNFVRKGWQKHFEGQFERSLGKTPFGGADIGECWHIYRAIDIGDKNSWYSNWKSVAERLQNEADDASQKGHAKSAAELYLRACEYHRNSYFFLTDDKSDERIPDSLKSAEICFRKALPGLRYPGKEVAIPFEDSRLNGYFFTAPSQGPAPAVLIVPGYDSCTEEMYFYGAAAALSRGYHALIVSGPGQGEALWHRKMPIRPDWEGTLGACVDWLQQKPEVAPDQICPIGRSLGGYIVPQAATREKRFAAIVCDPIQPNLFRLAKTMIPDHLIKKIESGQTSAVNRFMERFGKLYPSLHWMINSKMNVHHAADFCEFYHELKKFNFEDDLDKISCPMILSVSEGEPLSSYSYKDVEKRVSAPVDIVFFKNSEGARGHCTPLAQSLFFQRIFDKLDEILR